MKKFFTLFLFATGWTVSVFSQFYVTPDTNVVQLVNNFILSGVTVSNVQYTGADSTIGYFTGGNQTNLGMDEGIAMTTGTFDTSKGPSIGDTVGAFACYANFGDGDSLLNTLIQPWITYDASILEFDLVPVGNVLEFKYVFASEEYPEFVGSSFNDVFGFFISGPDTASGNYVNFNIALLPDGKPVAINNVNADSNSAYFIDNLGINGQTIVFDGFTTVLTAKAFVVPGATYHLKMAIADAGDRVFDSGIFLKAQSMKSYFLSAIKETENHPVAIYPNPVNSMSVLELNLSRTGKAEISIFNITGKLLNRITTEINQPGKRHIPLGKMVSELPAGIYFIAVQTEEGKVIQRFVK